VATSPELSEAEQQTAGAFAYKWDRRETFDSPASRARARAWLIERYGDVETAEWWAEYGSAPVVVDAGCGAGLSAIELLGDRLHHIRYIGADVSSAVSVAAERFAERDLPGSFVRADVTRLPIPDGVADVILSEGVLHHTDSTERALRAVTRVLRPGGRILFYVYLRKGPVREFTDDYIRGVLHDRTPEEAWDALMPLTELGQALGDLGVTVDVPRDVGLLGIPAGRIDVQRLFYWYFCKAFAHPDLTLDELNHINYDWYAPRNAHRQTPEQVRSWCDDLGLEVERERAEEAGITIVARATR
jgi:arsenite methyltransferase